MNIMPSQYIVTLYIQPDKGPISPIEIDLLSIETTIMGLDAGSNRDESRIRQIAAKIKTQFPDVDPYRDLSVFSHFVRRLSHVALFSGVVVRLPGTIQGQSQPPNPTADQIQRLADEAIEMRKKLGVLEMRNKELEVFVPTLKTENEEWRGKEDSYQRKIDSLHARVRDAELNMSRAQADAQRQHARVIALEQENAALLLQEEQSQRERQAALRQQNEIASLREINMNLRAQAEQLQISLEQRDQELKTLRARLRRLAVEGPDQAKPEWLD